MSRPITPNGALITDKQAPNTGYQQRGRQLEQGSSAGNRRGLVPSLHFPIIVICLTVMPPKLRHSHDVYCYGDSGNPPFAR